MLSDPASIAHRITADYGAGHKGAAMLFNIATVITASRRLPVEDRAAARMFRYTVS
jgi:hypothetical protein